VKLPSVEITVKAGNQTLSFSLKNVRMTVGKKLSFTDIEIIGTKSRVSFLLGPNVKLDVQRPPKRVKCVVVTPKEEETT